jgi:hypothetical protein
VKILDSKRRLSVRFGGPLTFAKPFTLSAETRRLVQQVVGSIRFPVPMLDFY